MKKLNSPFPWVGGKRLLRDHIISLIPEHRCYIEAFAGGAWVYWGKEPSKVEVINDLDGSAH
jgi:DNA adenine methylase